MNIGEQLNLALAHEQAGRLPNADAVYRQILAQYPNQPKAMLGLAKVLRDLRQWHQAGFYAHQAVALNPREPQAYNILGYVMFGQNRCEEALDAFSKMLALSPENPAAINNVGMALYGLRRMDECIAAFKQALAVKPEYPDALNNLGNAYATIGDYDPAIPLFEEAIRQRPDYPSAHWNLGLARLVKGDLAAGWPEYEWRWRVQDFYLRRNLPKPAWDGAELDGKTLFLYSEQGFGDAIQFIRYVPQIKQRGGRIVVVCQPDLIPLFRQINGVEEWRTIEQPLPAHDVHSSLLSLPMAMRTTLENIPAAIPYLAADPALASQWAATMPANGKLKIGIAWAGRPVHDKDRARSLALSALAPLAAIPNASLFSLQKGEAAAQIKAASLPITDWTANLKDFADTAALVANLDLVITADTAVAHLAGAMGRRVWVLLPYAPDWRWMLNRPDSPWYPTMRLFRQPALGDWDSVVRAAAAAAGALPA